MNIKSREQSISKYVRVLTDLHKILKITSFLSVNSFCENQRVGKNLSTALTKLGILKLVKKGRPSQWQWVGPKPDRKMAIKVLKEIASYNPQHKKRDKIKNDLFSADNFPKVNSSTIEYYELKLMFGLITLKFTPKFK